MMSYSQIDGENTAPSNIVNREASSPKISPAKLCTRKQLTIDVSQPRPSLSTRDKGDKCVFEALQSPSALERIAYIDDGCSIPLPPDTDEVMTPKPRIKETRLTIKPRKSMIITAPIPQEDWYALGPIDDKSRGPYCPVNHIPFVGISTTPPVAAAAQGWGTSDNRDEGFDDWTDMAVVPIPTDISPYTTSATASTSSSMQGTSSSTSTSTPGDDDENVDPMTEAGKDAGFGILQPQEDDVHIDFISSKALRRTDVVLAPLAVSEPAFPLLPESDEAVIRNCNKRLSEAEYMRIYGATNNDATTRTIDDSFDTEEAVDESCFSDEEEDSNNSSCCGFGDCSVILDNPIALNPANDALDIDSCCDNNEAGMPAAQAPERCILSGNLENNSTSTPNSGVSGLFIEAHNDGNMTNATSSTATGCIPGLSGQRASWLSLFLWALSPRRHSPSKRRRQSSQF